MVRLLGVEEARVHHVVRALDEDVADVRHVAVVGVGQGCRRRRRSCEAALGVEQSALNAAAVDGGSC